MRTTYCIDNLCCAEEEQLIREHLKSLPGVGMLSCDLLSRRLTVDHSCPEEAVSSALRKIGFDPRAPETPLAALPFFRRYEQHLGAGLSATLLGSGLVAARSGASEEFANLLFVLSMLTGGWRIALKAWHALRRGSLDMNVLMCVAAAGAGAIGRWEEGAAVIFLFAVSHLLERYSIDRSRKALHALLALSPPTATLRRGSAELTVRVGEINVGDRLIIRPGERIPLDGEVVAGESSVNQAPITGESRLVRKRAPDTVYAGSMNERGMLEVRVLRRSSETVLSSIVRMVEEAQKERAPIQQLTDRFARIYTPAVIAAAIALVVVPPVLLHQSFGPWFYRSLVLLVVACPCALVISTPVTILSGLSSSARNGVLLKGGRYLEEIGRVSAIAFDKTGTLTLGRPAVTEVIPLNSLSRKDILHLAALIETKSEHPLAAAVLEKAGEESLVLDTAAYEEFEALTGRGVRAAIDGTEYVIGNHELIEEWGICSPGVEAILFRLEEEGKTAVILGTAEQALGIIAISDELRPEADTVLGRLRANGIERTIMLTGDNAGTAQAIARRTGIDEVYAGILPDAKASRIKALGKRYGSVAMVGDGINDAPALAAATVGIAMGKSGTDIALDTADIVLMSDDLAKLPSTVALGKRTLRIIRQNMGIALVTKLAFLVLGVAGIATLWLAVLADDGAALLVIVNGLRALSRVSDGTR